VISIRGKKVVEPPPFSGPAPLDPSEVTPYPEPLRGHTWYRHAKGYELQEIGRGPLDPTDRAVPDGPLLKVIVDGEMLYQPMAAHASGSYEALRTALPKGPPAPKQTTIRDALGAYDILTARPRDRAQPTPIRGAGPIVDRLRARGHELRVSASGASLVLLTNSPSTDLRALVWDLTPLLVPYLATGQASACDVSTHKPPVEAVTVELGGTPWCGTCQPKEKT
jgi:hypothetical protein